ncbi:MAG: HEAT repeat domain-containing protein [Nitrospiraceae bacterium]|nr:HEAT repeat domain-containing protein [Nitrospiraceae bacterium]
MPVDHSNLLHLASITTVGISALILLLLGWIMILRVLRLGTERRSRRMTAVWRPVLAECLIEVPEHVPSVHPRDHLIFLSLWNHCFESIRGDAEARLIELARRLHFDRIARELLQARTLRRRLWAIITLGHLRERAVWEELAGLLRHDNAFLSFVAGQALLQIDIHAAIPLLVPVISRRRDWSPLKIVGMLKAAGPDLAAEAIACAAVQAPPEISARLIRHLASTRSLRGLPVLRQFLREQTPSDEVLAACLFLFGECSDPADLPILRQHLSHVTWFVRLQAVIALGKAGTEEDEERLVGLLDDAQWWVRYRAGEALLSLPSMTGEKLVRLQTSLTTLESQEIVAPLLAKFRTAANHTWHAA